MGGNDNVSALFRTVKAYFLSPIVGVADTSPTRRTRPFCRYRDISPVSAGESTPKEEANYCLCEQREANSREGGFPKGIYFFTQVVGYFACAQYDVFFILRHSERSEESHRRTDGVYTFHSSRGIFRLRSI